MQQFKANLIIFLCILNFGDPLIRPPNLIHENLASNCLEQLAKQAYDFAQPKRNEYHPPFLLNYLISTNLTSPGKEIQEIFLARIHEQGVWIIEVFEDERLEFQPYSTSCTQDQNSTDCFRKHVLYLETTLYVMVFEELETLHLKMKYIHKTSSFNSAALCIIYFPHLTEDMEMAEEVKNVLSRSFLKNLVLVLPKNITHFNLYRFRYGFHIGIPCYSSVSVSKIRLCRTGPMKKSNIFQSSKIKNYKGCSLQVVAIPYEPFVIDEKSGFEIDLVHHIGLALNISMKVQLYQNATAEVLEKDSNGWYVGFLYPIYKFWALGIGDIFLDGDMMQDFISTVEYHYGGAILVVPRASFIPKWRVLFAIFSTALWSICVSSVIGFGLTFYIFKSKRELKEYCTIKDCIWAAFHLLIATSVPKKPVSDFTRVMFISLAIFAIIINATYTSSLITYLQTTRREYQVSSLEDIVENNLKVGAPAKFKEMFEASKTPLGRKILESYQTVDELKDSYGYWLEKVATEGNIATISMKLHVQNQVATCKPKLCDEKGRAKVFVFDKPLRIRPVGIIMRKGSYFENEFNPIIRRFIIESGIIFKIKGRYLTSNVRINQGSHVGSTKNLENKPQANPLSLIHIEGAFAILAMGSVCALFVFVIEIAFYRKKRPKLKKSWFSC